MGNLGFVTISHPDYNAGGEVNIFSERAKHSLKAENIDFVDAGLVNSIFSAREAGRRLLMSDVDGVVLFFASWLECSVAMAFYREIEHLPVCVWAFPMWKEGNVEKSTGSYVSFAMFKGVFDRLKIPYEGVLGMPEESAERVAKFCRAASAYKRLKRCRIGLVGYTSMSIYTGTFDHVLMRAMIGPEIEHIDAYSLIRRAEKQSEADKRSVVERLRQLACVRGDVAEESLLKASGLYLAVMELQRDFALDAMNAKCQYEFSKEYGMTLCVPLSLAADNGLLTSCEGDMLCTVSMLMLAYLTGQTVAYGDSINHDGNILKLSPCGFMPFSLGSGKKEITNFMPNCGFSGIQTSFVMKPGKVTVMRLIEDIGSYHIIFFTGEGLDTEKRQGYMPALDVRLDGDINALIRNYSGQHYAICYGDISEEIEMLAKILHINAIRI